MDCTVERIVQIMNNIAPEHQAEEWDNVGLLLGQKDAPVRKIMTSVDITPNVIKEAIDKKVDIIISHHPLIFKPIYSLESDNTIAQLIYPLIQNDIAVYSAHTNLDKAVGGTDDCLADILELNNIRQLDDTEGLSFGRIGSLEEHMDLISLAERVCKKLKAQRIDIVGERKRQVSKVAVSGGAGASIMKKALQAGAEVLITGEMKHHEAIEAELLGICVLAAGHFHTELPVMIKLIDRLQMTLDSLQYNIEIILSEAQSCPYISL